MEIARSQLSLASVIYFSGYPPIYPRVQTKSRKSSANDWVLMLDTKLTWCRHATSMDTQWRFCCHLSKEDNFLKLFPCNMNLFQKRKKNTCNSLVNMKTKFSRILSLLEGACIYFSSWMTIQRYIPLPFSCKPFFSYNIISSLNFSFFLRDLSASSTCTLLSFNLRRGATRASLVWNKKHVFYYQHKSSETQSTTAKERLIFS